MTSLRRTFSAACTLCVTLAISGLLAACGSSGSTAGSAIALVGKHSITRATLEHWTDVEAVLAYNTDPKSPVPSGVVPDPPAYVKCIAYLQKAGTESEQASLTHSRLKHRCQERHGMLQRHVLDILLFYYWLLDEGVEQGVRVTDAQVKKKLDQAFPSEGAYRRYLSLTGETPANERLIIEKDLLDDGLLQLAEVKARPRPKTVREHERMLATLATDFTHKWKARTSCSAGYIVPECKQYKGPPSLLAP
jgi:hypothetical protein